MIRHPGQFHVALAGDDPVQAHVADGLALDDDQALSVQLSPRQLRVAVRLACEAVTLQFGGWSRRSRGAATLYDAGSLHFGAEHEGS